MSAVNENKRLEKPPIKFSNLLVGSGLNMFEVSTLGQPLEVMKTTMAANRGDGMAGAIARIWSRGGVFGCKSGARQARAREIAGTDARTRSSQKLRDV